MNEKNRGEGTTLSIFDWNIDAVVIVERDCSLKAFKTVVLK